LIELAYNQVFSEYGYPISPKEWREWIRNSYGAPEWIQKNNLPLDAEKIRAQKKIIFDQLIWQEMELMPGAKNAVMRLSKKYPLCIASASRRETIEACLGKFHLTSKFKKIIPDEEVKRGKPHPDVFLRAAKVMGFEPSECLVLEDSPAGLKAAKAAGMKCVICPDPFSKTPLVQFKSADKIIKSLNEAIF